MKTPAPEQKRKKGPRCLACRGEVPYVSSCGPRNLYIDGEQLRRIRGLPVGVKVDSETRKRVCYGFEKELIAGMKPERCIHCGVMVGNPHHVGCRMEECPGCGTPLRDCPCEHSVINKQDAELSMRSFWRPGYENR